MTYKRVLLKLSGESLSGEQKFGISSSASHQIALAIQDLQALDLEVAVVIGGGNIFRGIQMQENGISRTPADHLGLLATLMNAIFLQQALAAIRCHARVMSAFECPKMAESYHWKRALDCLSSGEILLFAGGTGNPYFTTDTAAALRASEIQAELILKATKVDGIYDKDPLKYPDAILHHEISYGKILADKLQVMDATAIALCRENGIPIRVFNMRLLDKHQITQVLSGAQGTLVKE